MGPEELLKPACELSYVVARDGAESLPRIEAPAPMQSFLYVPQLPPRALTVAQQAIEEDPSFRRRVAERATEEEIGRAGFLWLHRPIGWAAEFEELSIGESQGDEPPKDSGPLPFRARPPGSNGKVGADAEPTRGSSEAVDIEAVSAAGIDADPIDDEIDDLDEVARAVSETTGSNGSFGSVDVFGNGARGLDLAKSATAPGRSEANAIEDELLNLRGLVDRLSSERKAVSGSVRQAEQDLAKARYQPSSFESDVYTLQSELEAARAGAEEARRERDTAIRQHSDSLTRQLELERELERSRELRAAIEREHAEADTSIIDVKESLARAEAALATATEDRDQLSADIQAVRSENEELTLELARTTEAAANQAGALEAQYKAVQAEAETLRAETDSMAARMAGVDNELTSTQTQLAQVTSQAKEAKSLVDALTEEKIDLASRLADTEAMLETVRTQLAAVKSDAEVLATDLADARAQRDGMSSQVDELHGSLTEALGDLGRVRSASDADRAALKEVRAERDLLRVRVGSLEQIERGLEAKLESLVSERDAALVRLEQARADIVERERHAVVLDGEKERLGEDLVAAEQAKALLISERDELRVELDVIRGRATELEVARDGLSVQVEQLTEENLAIQAHMVERDRQLHESSENQGRALSELAHRLSMIETERNTIEGDLRETEEQLAEALQAVERAMETAEKARQEKLVAIEAMKAAQFAAAAAVAAAPSADHSRFVHQTEAGPGGDGAPGDTVFGDSVRGDSVRGDSVFGDSVRGDSVFGATGFDGAVTISDLDRSSDPVTADPHGAPGFEASADALLGTSGDTATEGPAGDVFGATGEGDESPPAVDPLPPAPTAEHGSWPPPPGPDAVIVDGGPGAIGFGGNGSGAQQITEGDDTSAGIKPDDERPTRRGWGFGSRFRSDNDGGAGRTDDRDETVFPEEPVEINPTGEQLRPLDTAAVAPLGDEVSAVVDGPAPADEAETSFLPGSPFGQGVTIEPATTVEPVDTGVAAVAVAAGAARDDVSDEIVVATAKVDPELDLDSISSELSQAVDQVGAMPAEDDEDLDEISKLIKQTVTDFDPSGLTSVGGSESGKNGASGGRPIVDIGTLPGPNATGPIPLTPPSVFSDGDRVASAVSVDPDSTIIAKGGLPESPQKAFDDVVGAGIESAWSGSRSTKPGRRQIEIPAEIDDEVEMARQVVSSPDVVLLVDGDSVAKLGWPSLPVAQQRDALVSYLADLSSSTGASPDVVFDGRIGEEESLPASRSVRIRLSTPPTEPTAALDELVDAYPEQWPIAVVTDDQELSQSAEQRGATVLNNGQLLDLFIV